MKRLLSLALAFALVFAPAASFANEGGEGGGEGAKQEGPQFVAVGPLTVPVLRDGRIYQYVTLTVKLETKDAAGADEITKRLPSLNDAYLSSLYGAFYAGRDMKGPLIDLDKLRTRLASANTKVLPADVVQDILIQQVNQSTR